MILVTELCHFSSLIRPSAALRGELGLRVEPDRKLSQRLGLKGVIIKCEGFDNYQVNIVGYRHLTRRNINYLRQFTLYQPGCWPQHLASHCAAPVLPQ